MRTIIRTKEEIKRQKQEHSHNHNTSTDNAVAAARAQGRYTTMMGISLMHLISLRTRAMPISFLMAITSTIFLRVTYLQ